MKFSFIISGRLCGMNEMIKAARSNRFLAAKQKKAETTRCMYAIIAANVPSFETPVKIHLRWFEPNSKRDIDNIAGGGTKSILDALVEMKRITNDTRQWVKGISHEFPDPDPARPRVEVQIEEA